MRCFVVAGFLLPSASRGPSAIAELLVVFVHFVTCFLFIVVTYFFVVFFFSYLLLQLFL